MLAGEAGAVLVFGCGAAAPVEMAEFYPDLSVGCGDGADLAVENLAFDRIVAQPKGGGFPQHDRR